MSRVFHDQYFSCNKFTIEEICFNNFRYRSGNMHKATIGVIGGSGLYEIEGAKTIEEIKVTTPWGRPSDAIVIADIEGHRAAFLPRHGRGHVFLPHEVNYRANIAALKMIGVEQVVAFSAV